MPIVGANSLLGTLCHFDFTPLAYTEDEVLLLEMITPELSKWLENNIRLKNKARTDAVGAK